MPSPSFEPSSAACQRLIESAFGAEPGRWPLPATETPREHWLRAVAAAGQGYYGAAYAELAVLRRSVPAGDPLASLAYSTQGSLLRQLGGHREARGWDGRAALLAGSDVEARVDALVGLAADALGVGRFAASAALLDRAATTLAGAPDPEAVPERLAVRLQWVSAELAMARGEAGAAVAHARRAVQLAEAGPSLRHRVKSQVVSAAAACCAGQLEQARRLADAALETTAALGLVPLRWALASLLAGIGSDAHSAGEVAAIRDSAAVTVRRRGGTWRS